MSIVNFENLPKRKKIYTRKETDYDNLQLVEKSYEETLTLIYDSSSDVLTDYVFRFFSKEGGYYRIKVKPQDINISEPKIDLSKVEIITEFPYKLSGISSNIFYYQLDPNFSENIT
jgi:hypothetical protein